MHRNSSLGSWIFRRAERTPSQLALIHDDRRWSYRELSLRINRVAQLLIRTGVQRGDRVAVVGENHPAHLEAFFACGLVGAIFVPIHPGFSEAAMLRILSSAECAALVFTPEQTERTERLCARVPIHTLLCTGRATSWALDYEEQVARAPSDPIDRDIGLDDLCVLAFTSGTTDDNKGVMLSHGNLAFNVFNLLSSVDYVSDDVMLVTAPLYRMGGLGFVLPILFKGGTCVLAHDRSPDALLASIERHRVTVLFDTPLRAEALARCPSFLTADLSSIRVFVCGGDALREPLVHEYLRRGVLLLQGYGLTEASPVALMPEPEEVERRVGSVGRPPLFSSVRIVDEELRDVPPGDLGELLVHGPNVMRGYWRREDATRRALTPDGWLRTGDAARCDEDGNVTIVARVADAMRIDGALVYPQPIERVLAAHFAECAVAQPSPGAPPVAFAVAPADIENALRECRAVLPASWVPEHVYLVSALPRNANGKLLRNRLPALVLVAPALFAGLRAGCIEFKTSQ